MENRIKYKNIRIAKGYTYRTLAQQTGINYQQIRRFENGEAELNKEQLKCLETVLDVDHYEKGFISENTLNLFYGFYDSLIYDRKELNEYKQQIYNDSKDLSINENIIYQVMRYILCVCDQRIDECLELESELLKYEINDTTVKTAFLDYMGMRYFTSDQHDKAVNLYDNLLSANHEEKVEGMLRYHVGFILKDLNDTKKAMKNLSKARQLFMKSSNIKRLFGCNLLIASVELRERDFDSSEKDYNYCVQLGKTIHIEESELAKVYRNLTWLMIKMEDYTKANLYLEKAKAYDSKHPIVKLYSIWLKYKNQNYPEALMEIHSCHNISDTRIAIVLELFENLSYLENRKPTKKIIDCAIKVYKYHKKTNDIDLSLFYLDIVIELLERKNDIETLNLYLKEKIFLLENKSLLRNKRVE